MSAMPDDWYREQARRLFEKTRDEKDLTRPATEVVGHGALDADVGQPTPGVFREEKPMVSRGTNPGAWVMLWAWIPDPPEVKGDGEKTC